MTTLPDDLAQKAETVRETATLGRGETEAILLAQQHDARCLTDDHAARTTAESLGVDVGGTIYVLLEALATDRLTYVQYVDRIDALADSGFHMGASLYRHALTAGKDLTDE